MRYAQVYTFGQTHWNFALNMAATPATRSLACEQTLALAMARHARLGAASSAALLEADTVALIFSFVQEAHEELVATKRIASIHVRAGDVIDGIEIRYSDGTHVASGGNGGRWLRPLRLQPGEFITRVGGNKGLYLDSIEFRTSHGAVIRFPGRLSGGVPFVHDIATGHELEHLECLRAPGGWLRSIEGLATQETPWTSRMARLLLGHPSASFLPCPNGPFIQRVGALSAFHDIEVRVCTLAEARRARWNCRAALASLSNRTNPRSMARSKYSSRSVDTATPTLSGRLTCSPTGPEPIRSGANAVAAAHTVRHQSAAILWAWRVPRE